MFERKDYVELPDLLRAEVSESAKQFASETRTKLGIGPDDGVDILHLLHLQGVLVFQIKDLGPSGFVRVFGKRRAIFLNASEPVGRQHYTAAHEFAHILNHLERIQAFGGLPSEELDLELKKMEYFANVFADHFLMTEEAIRKCLVTLKMEDLSELSIQDVIRIQHYFGLSYRQITRMFNKFGFISKAKRDELNAVSSKEDPQRLVNETVKAGFSTELVAPLATSKIPEEFLQALVSNICTGQLTRRKVQYLVDLLGLPNLFEYLGEVGQSE